MSWIRISISALILAATFLAGLFAPAPGARAEGLSALARLHAAQSKLDIAAQDIELALAISQPVPWRVRLMADPPRLILDSREVDWTGLDRVPRSGAAAGIRAGVFREGWSRLVLMLDGPWLVTEAGMQTSDQGAKLLIRLARTTGEQFAQRAGLPEPPEWTLPQERALPPPVKRGNGPVVVVLDPGHGGLDPGAERGGVSEAALMLTFARELKEALLRKGGFSVVLTRDEDIFVPLETRISVARAAGADLFLSLHADALAEGEAQGATLYTLSEEASDAATRALAERHERDDLLAGIDLSEQDDIVASVLMDMARRETAPRSERLSLALETALKAGDIRMHRKPRQEGGFSVLKSPDIPSLLIELGFLSSERDLKRLTDPDWRARMISALVKGIEAWSGEDKALRAARATATGPAP